jgi:hypothetical protein
MTDNTQKVVVVKNNYENLFHLTTVVFVVLKLSGTVDWSWWLVFLPSILPVASSVVMLVFAGLLFLLGAILEALNEHPNIRKRRQDLKNLRRASLVEKIKNENKKT